MSPILRLLSESGDITQTHSAIWPERYEIIFGGFASILIFGLLYKFAGPTAKKALSGRTAKIQAELDAGESARSDAEAEAVQIRTAKGDIAAERLRILAEAETQAVAIRTDGRARIATEVADLEARAAADIVSAQHRVGDELRAEIARLSIAAVDHVVSGSLDDSTHQELIESFIARVGASS